MNKLTKWISLCLVFASCLTAFGQTTYSVVDSNNVSIGTLTLNKPYVQTNFVNVPVTNYVTITNPPVVVPPPVVTNPPPVITNNPPVITPPPVTNTVTPSVYAGSDLNVTSLSATLNGRLLTPTNGVTIKWTSTVGNATIASPNSLVTLVTFPSSGLYTFRLSAANGNLGGSDEVNVNVNAGGGTVTNTPPPVVTNPPPVINPTNPPVVVPPPVTNGPPPSVSSNTVAFYVRKSATGANNGSDWNNAWNDISKIQWGTTTGKVGPNAIVYVAGGTYSSFTPGASGTPNARIIIRKASSTIPDCVNASGWNSSFDSQVVVGGTDTGVTFAGAGSYLTIDGVVDSGIRIITPNSSGASISFDKATTGVTLTNLDLAGPGGPTAINMNGDNRGIDATAWNGSIYEPINNLILTHCRVHGQVNNLWLMNVNDSVFEYSKFYDSAAANSAGPTGLHANVVATSNSKRIQWRYNEIYNHQVEGIMFIFGQAQDWFIYGNVWHDGMTGVSRILEVQDGVEGPIYFYNNTVVNVVMGLRTANGGSYAAGSKARNNIFWNAGNYSGLSDVNYDLSSVSIGEANGVVTSTSPFVNGSFRLSSTSPAKNVAIDLGMPYNLDPDGKIRGADGMWDIGAYEQ